MQLREYIIQYDKRLGAGTVGNRNNLNQRACLDFLKLLTNDYTGLIKGGIEKQQNVVDARLNQLGPSPRSEESHSDEPDIWTQHIREVIKADDTLLDAASPDIAYNALKVVDPGGDIGTLIQFRQVWLRLNGAREAKQAPARMNKAQKEAATKALEGIIPSLNKSSGTGSGSPAQEKELVVLLRTFVGILIENYPDGVTFTSPDVFAWVKQYQETLTEEVPPAATNITKLAFFLSSHANELGLERIKVKGVSKVQYRPVA